MKFNSFQVIKISFINLLSLIFLFACESQTNTVTINEELPLKGTWELFSETAIQQGDTTITENRKSQKLIKIINDTHFAFLKHDLKKGKDSAAVFVAGGGSYTLKGDQYAEHLEYCNYREWEDHHFQFTVAIQNDTLVQRGIERIEDLGVNREIIEKYVRVSEN